MPIRWNKAYLINVVADKWFQGLLAADPWKYYLAVEQQACSKVDGKWFEYIWRKWATVTVAINSSHSSECCLRGAALAFDITRNEFTPTCKYASAPYAFGLVSANTWRVALASGDIVTHFLSKEISIAWSKSWAIVFHFLHILRRVDVFMSRWAIDLVGLAQFE